MSKIRVLLVDDHDLVRHGISSILGMDEDIDVVDEASNGNIAVTKYSEHKPDVVILDLSMPGLDGIDTTRRIKDVDKYAKVLILSMHQNAEYAYQVFSAGARGYISKQASRDELVSAIHIVADDEVYMSDEMQNQLQQLDKSSLQRDGEIKLSQRQNEILQFVAQGLTSQEIGEHLNVSRRTVETHRHTLMQKFGVSSTNTLVKKASDLGYLT